MGGAAVAVASGSIVVYYNSRKRQSASDENNSDQSLEEPEVKEQEEEKGEPRTPIKANLQSNSRAYLTPISYEPRTDHDLRLGQKAAGGEPRGKETSPSSSLSPAQQQQHRHSRIIPQSYLEKSKKELRTLLLEKELVSAALTRLYEAEAHEEITREERETLGVKYRDELKSLDERILKVDAFIEVGDLETLRDQLVRLVTQKIDSIEKRIENTRRLAEPLIDEIMKANEAARVPATQQQVVPPRHIFAPPKSKVPDISDLLTADESSTRSETTQVANETQLRQIQRPIEPLVSAPKVQTEEKRAELETSSAATSSNLPQDQQQPPSSDTYTGLALERQKKKIAENQQDSQAEQLQRELLEALDRLEKLDVES